MIDDPTRQLENSYLSQNTGVSGDEILLIRSSLILLIIIIITKNLISGCVIPIYRKIGLYFVYKTGILHLKLRHPPREGE